MLTPRYFILLSLFTCYNIVAQCPLDIDETTVAPTNNLLLHVPFDGNLTNLGSGNYSLTNSGAQFVPTQCGQGLFFDGNDDFVSVSPSMNLVNNLTVCAWISPTAQVDAMNIFAIREQCASTYRGYSILQLNLGDFGIPTLNNLVNIHQNCTGFSAGDRYTNTGITIPNNTETFVAITVQNNSSENRVVTLYVNCGEYTATQVMNYPTAVCFSGNQNYTTTIGANSGVPNQTSTFHGTIDQLRVYDVALNHEQILDVYQSCLPVSIDVTEYPDCNADSAEITVFNTELDVNYQLFNATTNTPIGAPFPGNCGPMVFNTGIYSSTTQFEIAATNIVSGCSIVLDSLITLSPSSSNFTSTQNVTLCAGDSIPISSGYITSPGTYTDTIPISATCDSIITLNVTGITPYSVDLGPDFIMCPNSSQNLTLPTGATSYLWQDGSNSNSYQVIQAGTYWVSVTDQCGTHSDTVIASIAQIGLDLGVDTTICQGSNVTLDASTPSASYLWQDNSTGPTFSATTGGIYWVEVTASNCVFTDSLFLTVFQSPTVDLGSDTSICEGVDLLLSGTTLDVTSYLWSTNESSSSITVSQPGAIWLEGSNQCGADSDTIIVSVVPTPYFDLGNDTTLCQGTTLTLTAGVPNANTVWQDGSQASTFQVNQAGVYSAIVSSAFCDFQDEIQVTYSEPAFVDLGPDTIVCEGAQLFLTTDQSIGGLLWNTGSQESTIVVTETGIYEVSATNECGQDSDQIEVQVTNCSCELYVPNSFTPDDGDLNNTFGPVHECELFNYTFTIYDRWGKVVFESTNPTEFWNGKYLNKKVLTGTYSYQIQYDLEDQEEIFVTGHVIVLY